jgi:hypothetical protein
MPQITSKHWMVTVLPKDGSIEEIFWINSINSHSAVSRALRLCGDGARALSIQSLDRPLPP